MSFLGNFFGALGFSAVNNMFTGINNSMNFANDWRINERNIDFQRETNLENQMFTRENRDIMLNLQHQAWNREDNAVQRRVEDLRSAGMNPVLAAGQPAQSSAPVAVQGPHNEAPRSSQVSRMQAMQFQTDMVERALRMRDDFATNQATREMLKASANEHNARAESLIDEVKRWQPLTGIEWQQAAALASREGAQAALYRAQEETEAIVRGRVSQQTVNDVLEGSLKAVNLFIAQELRDDHISQTRAELAAQLLANEALRREELGRSEEGTYKGDDWRYNIFRQIQGKIKRGRDSLTSFLRGNFGGPGEAASRFLEFWDF